MWEISGGNVRESLEIIDSDFLVWFEPLVRTCAAYDGYRNYLKDHTKALPDLLKTDGN